MALTASISAAPVAESDNSLTQRVVSDINLFIQDIGLRGILTQIEDSNPTLYRGIVNAWVSNNMERQARLFEVSGSLQE